MKNIFITLIASIFLGVLPVSGQALSLLSPNGKITVNISTDKQISFSIKHNDNLMVSEAQISLMLDNDIILGEDFISYKETLNTVDEVITVLIPTKSKFIRNNYNEILLSFKSNYAIRFRAYNNGVTYRFESDLGNEIIVKDEKINLAFGNDFTTYFPEEESMQSHYERTYQINPISKIKEESFCSLPVLFQTGDESWMLITEADLYDYPGLFLQKENGKLISKFPKAVIETEAEPGRRFDRNEIISKEANYIALTKGDRVFPWRVFCLADNAGELVENNLVYQLSRPLKLKDTDWIKPGKVAWDWWNALNIYGVDFESGINNDTYKYYIDFASEFGLEYIILDEGWSVSTWNLTEYSENINIEELIEYANKKNVGIILWVLWKPLDKNMNQVLDLYEKWGVKGIKVDFMQRADQYMVNYYERVAKEAAKRHLLVDYHGAFKPSGLRRAYPNVVNYEGLKGMEHCKWSTDTNPEHDLTLPFIRMVAGPIDYTPGAMDNAQEDNFFIRFDRPMSLGTRSHQIAMYVLYESPLQMLGDNPSNYYRERETTEFIAQIPTVWDTTIVLEAKVADYLLLARKNGDKWYIGGMTDWESREFEIDFSFLDDRNYSITIMQDGINANKVAVDYIKNTKNISRDDKLKIKMAKGGGWAAIINPHNK